MLGQPSNIPDSMFKTVCIGLIFVWLPTVVFSQTDGWKELEPGLELAHFSPADDPDAVINVLRIDPMHFKFELFNASAGNNVPMTPKQWAESKGLIAVINASMFQEDLVTSVSLMRTEKHVNNNYVSKDKTILAFEPIDVDVPDIKIIDRECDDFDTWKKSYHTLVQSIRMISCNGQNVWRSRSEKWSVSAIAIDGDGKVLFIQTEMAFDTHEMINTLILLPLNIQQAMYVEGGPQAQLYVNSGGQSLEFVGQVSSFFQRGGKLAWPIPNIIGISRK